MDESELMTEEVDEAFYLFSQVAEIFLNNKVDDDFNFPKIREQVLEKFPQEKIKNASDIIKHFCFLKFLL